VYLKIAVVDVTGQISAHSARVIWNKCKNNGKSGRK